MLAILTPEQIGVSLLCGAILCGLWFVAEAYERWRGKTWRVQDDDQMVITSLYEYKRERGE